MLELELTYLQQIKTGLESLGFKPEMHELTWFQDDYGLKAGEHGDDEDEAGDEDEDEEDEGSEADTEDEDDEE